MSGVGYTAFVSPFISAPDAVAAACLDGGRNCFPWSSARPLPALPIPVPARAQRYLTDPKVAPLLRVPLGTPVPRFNCSFRRRLKSRIAHFKRTGHKQLLSVYYHDYQKLFKNRSVRGSCTNKLQSLTCSLLNNPELLQKSQAT